MRKELVLILLLIGLGTAVSAQTEADFQTSANKDGTVTITKYTGWDTDIKIPSTIGGKTVTGIGYQAFMNCDLTGVVIPDGVTSVGDQAFYGNKLTAVTVGKDFPFSKTVFGRFAYYEYRCNGEKAGTYTVNVEWDKEKPEKETDGFLYAETAYGLAITGYKGDSKRLSIPEKLNGKPVKYIEGLQGKGLTGLRIPDSVLSIGDNAFSNNQLTSLFIGNSVTSIGNNAFQHNQLTSVVIPGSVKVIAGVDGNYNNGNGVTTIGYRLFQHNRLTSVTMPDSVTSIGHSESGYGFEDFYNKNGKKAGTYTYNDAYGRWTYTAR